MLQVNMFHIKPNKEDLLRNWLLELNSRHDEVRETFREESVRGEQGFIVPTSDSPIMVYVIEAESLQRGQTVYSKSVHQIDLQHKEVMRECLGNPLNLKPIYDVAVS